MTVGPFDHVEGCNSVFTKGPMCDCRSRETPREALSRFDFHETSDPRANAAKRIIEAEREVRDLPGGDDDPGGHQEEATNYVAICCGCRADRIDGSFWVFRYEPGCDLEHDFARLLPIGNAYEERQWFPLVSESSFTVTYGERGGSKTGTKSSQEPDPALPGAADARSPEVEDVCSYYEGGEHFLKDGRCRCNTPSAGARSPESYASTVTVRQTIRSDGPMLLPEEVTKRDLKTPPVAGSLCSKCGGNGVPCQMCRDDDSYERGRRDGVLAAAKWLERVDEVNFANAMRLALLSDEKGEP